MNSSYDVLVKDNSIVIKRSNIKKWCCIYIVIATVIVLTMVVRNIVYHKTDLLAAIVISLSVYIFFVIIILRELSFVQITVYKDKLQIKPFSFFPHYEEIIRYEKDAKVEIEVQHFPDPEFTDKRCSVYLVSSAGYEEYIIKSVLDADAESIAHAINKMIIDSSDKKEEKIKKKKRT